MTTAVREAPHHRNLTCYTDYSCRRPECVERYTNWDRDRIARHAEGTWNNLVDAEPVRQHLLALEAADVLPNRIAKAAGIPLQTVRDFTSPRTRGRRYRTSPATAEKILAVTAADATPLYVDPTGTHRRLQALVAAGWPLIHIDRRLGYKRERMRKILAEKVVLGSTEKLVAATYEELRSLKPERHGVPKLYVQQAKQRAAARRWAPPSYWDQYPDGIDDPDFEPMYGVTRRQIVAQDANELMRYCGLDRYGAAERLGVHKSYLDHAFREFPEYALETAA
ncbi:hypothetical protein [Streptomyces sp. NPDC056105]|uniref:hypothetical protein n=1 Tax=Streptomyces sp. NPDC056105 TaxID=3345714 RepID=UPI0035D8B983